MATLTDQTAAVIDYLVAQCQANASLGAASPPVAVFDGPTISGIQLVAAQRIWIGAEGGTTPSGAEVEAATFTETFSFIDKARTRDNQIDVQMAAEQWSGDPTQQKVCRDGAFSLMAAVELMLRGDPSVGPGDSSMGGLVYWSQVTGPGQLVQAKNQAGVSALVRFRVTAFTRLTT
jgi:hypothetical protein